MRATSRTNRNKKSEQAQSLVELAVSFMLIMFILAGAVDFGRAYFALIALRDAAQEGVIYASINPEPGDVDEIEERVKESSSNPIDFSQFTGADIDISWEIDGVVYSEGSPPANPCAGFYNNGSVLDSNSITVTVKYDFPFTMPMISNIFPGGTLQLSVDDQHTILRPQCLD